VLGQDLLSPILWSILLLLVAVLAELLLIKIRQQEWAVAVVALEE
jgi:hypothetical protein